MRSETMFFKLAGEIQMEHGYVATWLTKILQKILKRLTILVYTVLSFCLELLKITCYLIQRNKLVFLNINFHTLCPHRSYIVNITTVNDIRNF